MSAQPPATKVAVISIQGAIAGTKEGQQASRELDAKVQPRQKEFDQRQTELAQLEDQLNKGSSVLNEDKRNQLVRDIDQKKKKLERDISDAKEEFSAEQQRLLQNLGSRMLVLIEKYAKDNGYVLVLDVSNPNTPILYFSSAIDITQDIIARYDKATPATPQPQK
jgi:outer membrane protein